VQTHTYIYYKSPTYTRVNGAVVYGCRTFWRVCRLFFLNDLGDARASNFPIVAGIYVCVCVCVCV